MSFKNKKSRPSHKQAPRSVRQGKNRGVDKSTHNSFKNLSKNSSKSYHSGKPHGPRPSLYGFHAVAQAFLNAERKVQTLYLTDQAKNGFEKIIKEAQDKGLERSPFVTIDKKELENMLPQGAVHQGIALVCSALEEVGVQDLLIQAQSRQRSLLLMLDQVTDPHNVGAIMRSACAFGAHAMIMQRKHAPDLGGVLAKTACGAVEHLPVAYETNLSRTLEELKSQGYFVYGLDERGEIDIGQANIPIRAVLVLGAEGPGLRRLVKAHCDELLCLPMRGVMPSINVSNAAAVALYAIAKQSLS